MIVETLFMLASGVFYPLESIIVNVTYMISLVVTYLILDLRVHLIMDMFEYFIVFGFNISETIRSYKFEADSYCEALVSNKTSIQYINFVSRLLPKHVRQI